ncbi:putative mariner transposase [Trichonephila clavipes]|nr:putative mariner transposase [Trichonephila clavipes]
MSVLSGNARSTPVVMVMTGVCQVVGSSPGATEYLPYRGDNSLYRGSECSEQDPDVRSIDRGMRCPSSHEQEHRNASSCWNQVSVLPLMKLTKNLYGKFYIELWKDKPGILQDNAPSHSALFVKRFLAKYSIPVLDYPPYSPDLVPCNFYVFPKMKSAFKGTRFESVEAMKRDTGTRPEGADRRLPPLLRTIENSYGAL